MDRAIWLNEADSYVGHSDMLHLGIAGNRAWHKTCINNRLLKTGKIGVCQCLFATSHLLLRMQQIN